MLLSNTSREVTSTSVCSVFYFFFFFYFQYDHRNFMFFSNSSQSHNTQCAVVYVIWKTELYNVPIQDSTSWTDIKNRYTYGLLRDKWACLWLCAWDTIVSAHYFSSLDVYVSCSCLVGRRSGKKVSWTLNILYTLLYHNTNKYYWIKRWFIMGNAV